MSQLHRRTMHGDNREYRENWTVGGFVMTLLVVPAFVALMAAPAIVTGMVLGVVALKLGEQLLGRYRVVRTRGFGDSRSANHPVA